MAQVFCAYCGKAFTRKEHLERHIPSHTNVKPHRCGLCHLSFARRDLLQRHHSTYHEARDPMEPRPGGVPTVAGRTPIACQNCANAKTGCDKRVPCSRCSEKNLQCDPRFARRSSKAAARAAQASATFNNNSMRNPHQHPLPQLQAVNAPFGEVEQGGVKTDPAVSPAPGLDGIMAMDPRLQEDPPKKNSPAHQLIGPDEFPSPHSRVDRVDDYLAVGNDYVNGGTSYPDLYFMPEYSLDIDIYSGPLPIAPRADMAMAAFPDLSESSSSSEPIASNSSRASIHTRDTSIDFENHLKNIDTIIPGVPDDRAAIPEFAVVIAAEAAWPLARCNPSTFSGVCPRTAIVHLECLEQKSKQEGTWRSLEDFLEQVDSNASDLASVIPLTSRTRDKMLAITQSFLHKALEIHRGGINGHPKAGYTSPGDFNFIVLPPSKILEYFLRSYVRSLSVYYPLVSAGCVDPNEMLQNNQASTLLVLLMIAQGAAALPMAEARYLAAGLTETCRISLFDIIEKDVELSADPVALRCALLFTVLGAWSGDKWLMDIAMGQRSMYLTMMKHAGMMEPQSSTIPTIDNSTDVELHWRAWMQREAQNRLVYNWVMLDQELSLFYDTAPILSINELQCPLPGIEVLWMAPNSEQWQSAVQSIYGFGTNVSPQLLTGPTATPSLLDFFQEFLHDNLLRRQSTLTPQQLRLLLHPLQSMLFHLRQMLSCFSDVLTSRRPAAGTVTKGTTLLRLQEVQELLLKWYEVTMNLEKANPGCPVTRCNLVLYHLVSLNAVTNFPEIERLARREGFDGTCWELSLRHKRCIFQREEAIMHCGQVFKLLRLMPDQCRPTWWAAAAYRATLILWADSIPRADPNFQAEKINGGGGGPDPNALVPVDQLVPSDQAAMAYVWHRVGVAVLTRPDKSTMGLDKAADVLDYGIRSLDEAVSSRIVDGIRRKLTDLKKNWTVDTMGAPAA